ncbi:hypothetical protein C4577_04495 [Candidatus Parcubacteria bacterium]|nr:MAG: hypothetical protein C4577_04495 [Candidatus Parcubacteria bacterium]
MSSSPESKPSQGASTFETNRRFDRAFPGADIYGPRYDQGMTSDEQEAMLARRRSFPITGGANRGKLIARISYEVGPDGNKVERITRMDTNLGQAETDPEE